MRSFGNQVFLYFIIEVCRNSYHNHMVRSEDKMIGLKVSAPGIRVQITTK